MSVALAIPTDSTYGMGLRKARVGIRIQKPEMETLWQSARPRVIVLEEKWRVLVGLTYVFSLIGLFFAFSA